MKKILLIAVLLGAMLSVTVYFVCIAAPSVLFGKGLKGSGNIVTRTIEARPSTASTPHAPSRSSSPTRPPAKSPSPPTTTLWITS